MKRPVPWMTTGASALIGDCYVEWRVIETRGMTPAAYSYSVIASDYGVHHSGRCVRLRCARRAILRIARKVNRDIKGRKLVRLKQSGRLL